MSVLKSPEWVYKRLMEKTDQTVIVDVRFHLTKPDEGRKAYTKGHVPGAVFIDLKEDLSRNPEEHGGRHPLQDPDLLAAKLGKIGIDRQTDVVVYDDSGGCLQRAFGGSFTISGMTASISWMGDCPTGSKRATR